MTIGDLVFAAGAMYVALVVVLLLALVLARRVACWWVIDWSGPWTRQPARCRQVTVALTGDSTVGEAATCRAASGLAGRPVPTGARDAVPRPSTDEPP